MEQQVRKHMGEILSINESDITSIERLMGGMSNFMYRVDTSKGKFTYRIPGKKAELWVDRRGEYLNGRLVESLNINPRVVYFDIDSGIKVSEFVEGKDLSEINAYENMEGIVGVLKKLHMSGIESRDYDHLKKLESFESHVLGHHHKKYFDLKEKFLKHWDYLSQTERVYCHSDALPSNIVKGEKQYYLLDWEFAAMNDPVYDIAHFGEFDIDLGYTLLEEYYGQITEELHRRFCLWSISQSLQWYNVAMYKEIIGMSEELEVNFAEVCEFFLTKIEGLFERLEEFDAKN